MFSKYSMVGEKKKKVFSEKKGQSGDLQVTGRTQNKFCLVSGSKQNCQFALVYDM